MAGGRVAGMISGVMGKSRRAGIGNLLTRVMCMARDGRPARVYSLTLDIAVRRKGQAGAVTVSGDHGLRACVTEWTGSRRQGCEFLGRRGAVGGGFGAGVIIRVNHSFSNSGFEIPACLMMALSVPVGMSPG